MTNTKNGTMKPIANPKLKEAIDTLKKEQSKEHQDMLFAALKDAKLLAPAIFDVPMKPDQKGRIQIPKNAKIKFVLVNTREGKTFFPAFTDHAEAQKLHVSQPGSQQQIVRTLNEYASMLQNPNNQAEGIVINPMSENIIIPKALIERLVSGNETQAQPFAPGANVMFTEPSVYPTQMVNAVHDACKEMKSVSRVWLKEMISGPAMAFLLIVDAEKPDAQLFASIKEVAEPLSKKIPVSVAAYSEELEEKAVKGAFPLYDSQLDI